MAEDLFLGRTYDDFLFRPERGRAGSRQSVREESLAFVRPKALADPGPFLIPLSAASRRESFER